MDEGNTLVNALLGAAVSILAGSIVPFAPVLGGALAGYLQGGDRSEGLRVGFISGLVALVPTVLIGFLVMTVIGVFFLGIDAGAGGVGFGVFGLVFVVFGVLFSVLYIVGLSTAGGWVGNYVKYDTDVEL